MDALRLRLEEKEATLNKKTKQIQETSEEKGTLNGEIHDLKDMLEVKERKVNVLQKKVSEARTSVLPTREAGGNGCALDCSDGGDWLTLVLLVCRP